MVLQILKPPKQPLKNTSFSFGFRSSLFDERQRFISQEIIRRIKNTPELIGILDTLVTDHFQGPVDFFTPDEKPLGPTKLRQVKDFWNSQDVMQTFYGQAIDYFIDGSSFGWYVSAKDLLTSKQKEALTKLKRLNPLFENVISEQVETPRNISYLAASTVEIVSDDQKILSYIQDCSGRRVEWKPEQIVHIKLMEFNGEFRGFSGLKALVKEISMMYMLKENIIAALMNGGSPDHIISLKGANGFSKARFERMRIALESFSHLRKSHGNLPIDAEVQVHKLGTDLKDMEYRELAMFALSEFCLALGVPTSRIPFLMTGSGGNANRGEMSGNSEDSYQKKVNNRRLNWESKWNKVFSKSGFIFRFRRDNVMDEVKETQAASQRSAFVLSTQNVLRNAGKELTEDALVQLLSGTKKNISLEDLKDLDPKKSVFLNNPVNQNDLKANIPKDSEVNQVRSQFYTRFANNKGES